MACQPIQGYFIPRGKEIAFIVYSYFGCFLRGIFKHTLLSSKNNFLTDQFDL